LPFAERKPLRALELLRVAKKKGFPDADWLLTRLEKFEICSDDALRSCFEGDQCGRALSFYAWFSGPKKKLPILWKAAEAGDAFGQFMLAVLLQRDGNRTEAAKWMQRAVTQGFPDAVGHFVFNEDFREGSDLSNQSVHNLCKDAALLGSGPCLELMAEKVDDFQEKTEWLVRWAIRRGSMGQLLRDSCIEALKALKENSASDKHLLFLYVCGREFDGYEELFQALTENLSYSSHQEYVVPMISFYVQITHLARDAALFSILCLKGFVHKDCVTLIAKRVFNTRFEVKAWKKN
jgi:hypothetical protein